MRFCQTDGTPLVEIFDIPATDDPYKTVVGRQSDTSSNEPLDPFKTMVAGSRKNDESGDLLQLPTEQDPLKTMYISDEEMKREMSAGKPKKDEFIDVQPVKDDTSANQLRNTSAGDSAFSSPSGFDQQKKSEFGETSANTPISGYSPPENAPKSIPNPFEDKGRTPTSSPFNSETGRSEAKSPFDSTPFNNPSTPIPSPFGESKPSSYQAPSDPLPTAFKEEEIRAEAFNTPFAEEIAAHESQPLQQTEWTPPPAPDSNWQNQEVGANTPFQPPVVDAGQNKTLSIVSLVLGILSIPCCGFIVFGIAAAITGFLAKNKADQNPQLYGGRGMALAGMIIGIITTVIGLILTVVQLFIGLPGGLGNFR